MRKVTIKAKWKGNVLTYKDGSTVLAEITEWEDGKWPLSWGKFEFYAPDRSGALTSYHDTFEHAKRHAEEYVYLGYISETKIVYI